MLYILNTSEIELNNLKELIPYFPKKMQDKFNKIKDEVYQKNSLIAYLLLIFYIKKHLGVLYFPVIEKGESNTDLGFNFSISHTNNYVGLLISHEKAGFDMEEIREVSVNFKKRAKANSDLEALKKWTAFEALYKMDNLMKLNDLEKYQDMIETKVLLEQNLVLSIASKFSKKS